MYRVNVGLLNKPTFKTKWYESKKPPALQIKILKLITLRGEVSKKKANEVLNSNYSDISYAMDALAATGRQFIKLSHETGRRRPEKFYKITEKGLRALLAICINVTSKESIITSIVFWKLILLLSVASKRPISSEELDNYYIQFEKNSLGHSTLRGHFLQSSFFDIVLDNWLQNLPNNSPTQMVIECLAIHRSITLDDLINKTNLKKDEVITIIQNHTVQIDAPPLQRINSGSSNFDDQKQFYINFILRALINKNGDKYELSLFGVMLMISLNRYNYRGIDNNRSHNSDSITMEKSVLFYKNQFRDDNRSNNYCDTLARNYKEKLPLIFGKWNFLQKQLGLYLYDSFDFIIYKKHGTSTINSVWIGGNKEFYEDIQALASNIRDHLSPLYIHGKETLNLFLKFRKGESFDIMDTRLIPLRKKIHDLELLFSADIPLAGSPDTNHFWFASESESQRLYRLNLIERIFAEELTFLFYLNLNTISFSGNIQHSKEPRPPKLTQDEIEELVVEKNRELNEMSNLGSPIERLMAILTKDDEIKQWFTERTGGIMHYRKQTLNKMTEFYNEILDSHKYIKNDQSEQNISIYPQEYDIRKICSDFN